jgi:putative ABC transport system ATP-binding protein
MNDSTHDSIWAAPHEGDAAGPPGEPGAEPQPESPGEPGQPGLPIAPDTEPTPIRHAFQYDTEPIVELENVTRIYQLGHMEVAALNGVSLTVRRGEFVSIVGQSGSGKSTLMNIVGCLDRPTAGTYRLAGAAVSALRDDTLALVRNRTIGFVFQSYNLLPRTKALENVATPLMYQGVGRKERNRRAQAALERLGLGDRLHHEPTELSGGQQQRVAIARALVTDPALLLADEPTGNLDSHSGAEVLALLRELHDAGRTIVLITHDTKVAAAAPRTVRIADGLIVEEQLAA